MDFLKEFLVFSRIKFKIFPKKLSKFQDEKMQFTRRNFTNIEEIKRKIHGISQSYKRTRTFLPSLGYHLFFTIFANIYEGGISGKKDAKNIDPI